MKIINLMFAALFISPVAFAADGSIQLRNPSDKTLKFSYYCDYGFSPNLAMGSNLGPSQSGELKPLESKAFSLPNCDFIVIGSGTIDGVNYFSVSGGNAGGKYLLLPYFSRSSEIQPNFLVTTDDNGQSPECFSPNGRYSQRAADGSCSTN